MKRYTVAVVRKRLAEALDEAERGEPVFIERKGVRYRLSLDTAKPRRTRRTSRIQVVDPAVARASGPGTGRPPASASVRAKS
jgi:antitoxin (DNA-binding transcriptional repressor) of toxin-antitoxin stability system